MYVIREILHCKPGKVRQMVEKFRGISAALHEMGQEPLRMITDVSVETLWTIVAEATVEIRGNGHCALLRSRRIPEDAAWRAASGLDSSAAAICS